MDLNNKQEASQILGPYTADQLLGEIGPTFFSGNYKMVISKNVASTSTWYAFLYGDAGPFTLDQAKKNKCDGIDAKSEELIAQGFIYNNLVFSLSLSAQIKWLGLLVGSAQITYPYTVPNIDNTAIFEIPDAQTVQIMYGTAMATVASILGSGTALKSIVEAALTVENINNVVDNR